MNDKAADRVVLPAGAAGRHRACGAARFALHRTDTGWRAVAAPGNPTAPAPGYPFDERPPPYGRRGVADRLRDLPGPLRAAIEGLDDWLNQPDCADRIDLTLTAHG